MDVICNIASLPERTESLKLTVQSILPQVNGVRVMLNGHREIPPFLINNPKISYVQLEENIGDQAKFFSLDDYEGYVMILDDDLQVPSGYVAKMIEGVDKYKGIVSLHGKTLHPRPHDNFIELIKGNYQCLSQVNEDVMIDMPGSGIMAYHTKYFNITPEDCPIENMADIWVAVKAKKDNVPMWVLQHESGYIKHIRHEYNIWRDRQKKSHDKELEIINKYL